jgi:hypothetical protein
MYGHLGKPVHDRDTRKSRISAVTRGVNDGYRCSAVNLVHVLNEYMFCVSVGLIDTVLTHPEITQPSG